MRMTLARLLSIIAMIGFIIGTMLTSPAWAVNAVPLSSAADKMDDMASMAGMSSMKGPMECCPQDKPAVPACPKDCPWAALCIAKCFPNTISAASFVVIASSLADPIAPGNDRRLDRLGEPPPPRPPRT